MDPMFKKVVILVNGKAKKAYICKCYLAGDDGSANYCNAKENSFKAIVHHLQKEHSILLPDAIICHQHEIIMQNTCSVISHYKLHTLEGCSTFNYQDESEECADCKDNLNCIKMCRPGLSCVY